LGAKWFFLPLFGGAFYAPFRKGSEMKLGIALLVLAGAIIITATVIEGQNSGQHQANSNGNGASMRGQT
jgi:hypothetical protein